MGTWDIGFFDNDMACDWENEIKNNKKLSYIEQALLAVINDKEETLDIDEANRALAAAASLSKLLGSNLEKNSYTKHIDKWSLEFNEEVPKDLLEMAVKSLENIVTIDSELRQFWTIRGELENWKNSINELKEYFLTNYEK